MCKGMKTVLSVFAPVQTFNHETTTGQRILFVITTQSYLSFVHVLTHIPTLIHSDSHPLAHCQSLNHCDWPIHSHTHCFFLSLDSLPVSVSLYESVYLCRSI